MRDVANYQLRSSNVLFGRGLLQRVCVHKCFLTVIDLTSRDMCSRAISSHEAADNLTLRQAQPARRMAAALSIAARMAFQVVLASWQRRALAGQACILAADIQPSARSGAEN